MLPAVFPWGDIGAQLVNARRAVKLAALWVPLAASGLLGNGFQPVLPW